MQFIKLQLSPASAATVPPSNMASPVTQDVRLTNTTGGQKALVMRMKVEFDVDGRHEVYQGEFRKVPKEQQQ